MSYYALTPEAEVDVTEIQDYIAADNPEAAKRVVDRCFKAFSMLAENPYMGHRRDDLTQADVRFWPVYSYLIIYESEKRPIVITRILSSSRDVASILSRSIN